MANRTRPTQDKRSAAFTGIPRRAFTLLADLSLNNEPGWVARHAADVERFLRDPFRRYLIAATEALARDGSDLRGGAETMFRMRRDMRFSADPRPLWESVEAVLSSDGQRIGARAAIHVCLDSTGGFLAAGSFRPSSAARRVLRGAMVARESRFLDIAANLEAAGVGLESDIELVRGPRGFAEHMAGPLGPFLRMQEPVARRRVPKASWLSGRIVGDTTHFTHTVRSWLLFQREAFAGVDGSDAEVPDAGGRRPRVPRKVPKARLHGRR